MNTNDSALAREGWHILDERLGVLWREYEFTKGGLATTLVFRGTDGLVVVSPASRLEPRAYDALAELGPVRALVANNSFHHFGQQEWRTRFPDAISYCPAGAVATLDEKVRGLAFQPLSALPLPRHVHWEEPPGFKTGETLLGVDTARGSVWYGGDLFANIHPLPPPPLRWLFTLTGSAPGLRLFRLAAWRFVNDKKALREWLLARVDRLPPSIVVPAHGAPVDAADVAEQLRAQVLRL